MWRAVSWLGVSIALGGCALAGIEREPQEVYSSTVLAGRIDCPIGCRGPLLVAAYQAKPGRRDIAHSTRLHEPGGYELIVPEGEYDLFAFDDANDNGVYDDGEPAGEYPAAVSVSASGSGLIAGLDFALGDRLAAAVPPGTVFRAAGAPRHSTQVGALIDLDAPAFSAENGRRGYWDPIRFFKETGGNICFLEPYDPRKIPILFVHGAAGSPQDWRYFVDHLDRSRYQPWFFYYPSGTRVEAMASLLFWKLFNLQMRYRLDTLYITAHSMGGLVVRSFLLDHGAQFPEVTLFVSLSTPWAGDPAAELGARYSPVVVPSWNDVRPQSRLMKDLFARRLSPGLDYYLLFGHKGGYSMFRPNNDGTITLASQLRGQAQTEARRVYGFDDDHVSILSSPQVIDQYRTILAAAEQKDGTRPPSGQVEVRLSLDGNDAEPKGLPVLLLTPLDGPRERPSLTFSMASGSGGATVGPIPPGRYEASLIAPSFKTEPRMVPLRIEAGQAPALAFRLAPSGTLNGYIAADRGKSGNPAGTYLPANESVRMTSVVLEGAGIRRTLLPRLDGGEEEAFRRYLAGEDDAYKAFFSFVELPAGEYELTINAEGYQPHVSRHTVVPGRPGQFSAVVLSPRP